MPSSHGELVKLVSRVSNVDLIPLDIQSVSQQDAAKVAFEMFHLKCPAQARDTRLRRAFALICAKTCRRHDSTAVLCSKVRPGCGTVAAKSL